MKDDRRFAILMNPTAASGKPLRLLPEVQRELHTADAPHRVIQTRDLAHATHAARDAADKGEIVVALGGDGLVGTLAGALHGSAALGVLPGGRGNDFARALGIPQDIPGACKVLLEGVRKALDLGEANGKSFACIASMGYDSEANRIANEARLVRGNLVYAYAAIRALMAWKPARFTVRLDGREERFEGYTVAAANTGYYGGGMHMAPGADPSDGMLEVIFVEQVSKRRFLANLPKVFKGEHVQEDTVKVLRAREVEVTADRPFDVYADGEPITTMPVSIRLVRGGLSVIAPPAAAS
jgi:YegS/Rv2252/BmrU family lipid kinase